MSKPPFKINDKIISNVDKNLTQVKDADKTKLEQEFNIKFIEIEKIYRNEKNFYNLSDIEELAEDIKINGLQHNLVVRKVDDKYELISGERRYLAMTKLHESGDKKYSKVPCKVTELNDLDSEIVLIQANAMGRELTEKEKLEAVARLTKLYEEKKKRREKVPGRIRELVAKDIGLKPTQVGRFDRINKKLVKPLKEAVKDESLTIANASEFASLSEESQYVVADILKETSHLTTQEGLELKKRLKKLEEDKAEQLQEALGSRDTKKVKENPNEEQEEILNQINEEFAKELNEVKNEYTKEDEELKKYNSQVKLLNHDINKALDIVDKLDENKEPLRDTLQDLLNNVIELKCELESVLKG